MKFGSRIGRNGVLSSLPKPFPQEEKKAFWSRIVYLTSCYKVYCRNLFVIIKEKF